MRTLFFLLSLCFLVNSATITQITGSGKVNSKPVKVGMRIVEGDTITADDESVIYILISEGTGVSIKNGSTMIMGEDIPKKKIVKMNLLKGYLQAIVKRQSDFEIRTITATSAVRGTILFARHDDKGTYFCTCNGTVDYENAAGKNKKSITAVHHAGIHYNKSGDIEECGMEDHTDTEIFELMSAMEK